MRSTIIDLNAGSRFVYGQPYVAAPPFIAFITDTGLGKTWQWLQTVALPLVQKGLYPILVVPRHRLGDEIVAELARMGITACVYRGREADDPHAPGELMCRELERVEQIGQALGRIPAQACENGERRCPCFEICGYQRQHRQRPQMWIVPHQLLCQERPDFVPEPAALGIDEDFSNALLKGFQPEVKLWLRLLKDDRSVPRTTGGLDPFATADLTAISDRVHAVLAREKSGRIRPSALVKAGITAGDLHHACVLEWRRKKDPKEVYPGMPMADVRKFCQNVAKHNQEVARLARFWKLLRRTLEIDVERSPWLELRTHEPVPLTSTSTEPAVLMTWREDIHETWDAPSTIMNATMVQEIVRQFYPDMREPIRISAPAPHVYIRQIVDRKMSASMLIPSENASDRTNRTRQHNTERVRRFIEVRANDVRPGRVLVVCQLRLEMELKKLGLPENVDIRHFNDIAGENAWSDVALLVVIGRTEAPPADVEAQARALFGADIAEIPDDWYPNKDRGVLMRDGQVAKVESPAHPDPRAEAVRWSICEAGVMQAIGRGRAINRTAENPLQIDILTDYALPLVIDEFTTWDLIQPTDAEVMRARGAVPLSYRDMAAAYPDLFKSDEAARKTLRRENPGQMPIEEYLIGVCPGFWEIDYRRVHSRGPGSTLFFDPARVTDPVAWLAQGVGEVAVEGAARRPMPIGFKEYIMTQPPDDTPEGDFIEDAQGDPGFPDAKTLDQLEGYLFRRGACSAAVAAGRVWWRRYLAASSGG